ncbi:MAG: prepilin-type N-terminal cleavage/methylation domain-containing protein [Melioribacteraceae bacterium]|nr:prepilin-type N-terminal cleavage/methylation domain-containing protein [Melioribacteraceae bacterium]MCF8395091.1 prepilin-type N-terminal cleavage/methylation domain-containing protein [Melioribacteraceae bacterium]MCF8420362.1 prepilin-type N-terminal cleavage/methylation domain-containing protein [Melioribacteraceae bacterium]
MNNNKGFTLIEVLISINLSFLLVSFAYAFYLFSFQFSTKFINSYDRKNDINELFIRLTGKLESADSFEIIFSQHSTNVLLNKRDTVKFSGNSITLMNLYGIDEIENYNILFNLTDGEEIEIVDGAVNRHHSISETTGNIFSADIRSIKFEISDNNKIYSLKYVNSRKGVRRFKNVYDKQNKQ